MFRSRRGPAIQKLCSRRASRAAVGMAVLRRVVGKMLSGWSWEKQEAGGGSSSSPEKDSVFISRAV